MLFFPEFLAASIWQKNTILTAFFLLVVSYDFFESKQNILEGCRRIEAVAREGGIESDFSIIRGR